MKSNVSRSCCPNISLIQRWTNWKSKKEDRLLCCLLFFLSLGFSLLSRSNLLLPLQWQFHFKSKRQPAASLINVVVPPSHGAGPHTTGSIYPSIKFLLNIYNYPDRKSFHYIKYYIIGKLIRDMELYIYIYIYIYIYMNPIYFDDL